MIDFTVNIESANLLRNNLQKIKSVFHDIIVKFENSETSAHTNIEWVTLDGAEDHVCEEAKKYITSLTNPVKTITLEIPTWFYDELTKDKQKLLVSIEKNCLAFINIYDSCHIKIQSIEEVDAVIAKSIIEKHINESKIDDTKTDKCQIKVNGKLKSFAYKLGYDDEDILVAANSFSENPRLLNENTLLQELVKKCPQKLKDQIFKNDEITQEKPISIQEKEVDNDLREIVIDGSNVAMCHGSKEVFSCRGIEIIVNWFLKRGHENIHVFVPQWRLEAPKPDTPITDQEILNKLHKEKILVFTPSRRINGRRVVCYDDRFIVKYAFENNGIIVSNDNFRDLQKENTDWKTFLEQHLLMFTFVNDAFMPPDDPLGRSGPTLQEFLKKGSMLHRQCPYKTKCTYGSKCRFYHPEKANVVDEQSLNADRLNTLLNMNKESKKRAERDLKDDARNTSSECQYTNTSRSMHVQKSCAIEHNVLSPNNILLRQDDIISRGMNHNAVNQMEQRNLYVNDGSSTAHKFPMQYGSSSSAASYNSKYTTASSMPLQHPQHNTQAFMKTPQYYNTLPHETNQYPIHPSPQRSFIQQPYHPAYDHALPNYTHNTPQVSPSYVLQNYNQVPSHSNASRYHPNLYNSQPQSRMPNIAFDSRFDPQAQVTQFNSQAQGNRFVLQAQSHQFDVRIQDNQFDPTNQTKRFDPRPQVNCYDPQPPVRGFDQHLFYKLLEIFPSQQRKIQDVLCKHNSERNINVLVSYVLSET